MRIFNLFGKKPQTTESAAVIAHPETTVLEKQQENIPPVDLFIDDEAPQSEQVVEQTQSKITLFRSQNHYSIGYNDGHNFHSSEMLEIGKRKIRTEFRFILEQEIEEMNQKKLQLKMLVVDVRKVSDDTREKLELNVTEIEKSLMKLEKEKELSVENEGLVSNAIQSYHQGFIQGSNDYIESEKFLNAANIF